MLYFSNDVFSRFAKDENGVRPNKVLFSLLKSGRWIFKYDFHEITNMAQMEHKLFKCIESCTNDVYCKHPISACGYLFWSQKYAAPEGKKYLEDDTMTSHIRVYDVVENKTKIIKAGKWFRSIILETEIGNKLPEPVINYLCEVFTMKWSSYVNEKISRYTLYVNDNFSDIYDSDYLDGDLCSCMVDEVFYSFYKNAVEAKAAYLYDNEKKLIVARAIIYTECHDDYDDSIWRLCERQYSTDGDESLKQLLVDKLYQGGYIDAHKKVGADCHSPSMFVDKNGNSLEDKHFWIECELGGDDYLSYQDSFKWYDYEKRVAYNYSNEDNQPEHGCLICLSTASGRFDNDYFWDNYHDYWCSETTTCYYHGDWYDVDNNNRDGFVWCELERTYYHEDDVVETKDYGRHPEMYSNWSDVLNVWYAKEDNLEQAELEYKEKNWYLCDYGGKEEYVEDLEDCIFVFEYLNGSYRPRTISREEFDRSEFKLYRGRLYDTLDYNDEPIKSINYKF